MKYLEEDFQDQSVDLTRARFACMDTTNVNSGERGGLKWYLKKYNTPLDLGRLWESQTFIMLQTSP